MSSNFSSDSSGNDSAPAAIKHPSTISGTNKRCKIDSSNKNATATAYDVTNIIAKKDGTVHNVRPVAVSYTQKRGNGGGGGGGGGVLSSSTSTTANHRQKKRKYQTFEDQLVQLADYKEKNGHCNVPQSFQGCRSKLGNWVCDMRTQYKKYKESKPSNMTNERISALEKLDFKWSKRHSFEDRLAQLADYKEKNGHCNVPQSFQGYGLGQWVDYQRKDYKKYKGSKPSNMKNERIRALEKLDFKWRIRTNFEDQLVQLADYKEKNGHCNVPQSFQGCRSKLGNWVSGMRTQYKKHKESKPSNMTNERVSALEKLDFKWQGNCGPAFRTLSLLAQQENDDNEVVAVARSVPTLEVPPTEVVIDVEKEDQIEREDDDQLFGDNTMTSSNNGDSDEDIGEDNVYRAEGDDHYYGNSDHDGGGWHDLGDDFHNSDDDSLVF
ncbi:hypothetical protein FRACYDRAFT_197621 [Fragilariopsis cylindrus CCMP1102]|uniref:Helicase-associated domain-containing protein n=1 Tax=Fragilariopsis cylindrus CCMP1102 TaxID=635003 RepID=A0A1E7EN09_9STRA|nr:hypothetical protein FRACYDRAFT_197621 [Fragilariopsis cylindrus CCMP1102]|eukprot:OEU07320.1 hypothetical protein FRACYDRAFT_197621 [Fragilariopsis cylindrus CCMP1102]